VSEPTNATDAVQRVREEMRVAGAIGRVAAAIRYDENGEFVRLQVGDLRALLARLADVVTEEGC
jgi:hypothetical protein